MYLLTHTSRDFDNAFRYDYLAHSYRKMHNELSANGFVLLFATAAELTGLLSDWTEQKRFPYGLIFFKVAVQEVEQIVDKAEQIQHLVRRTIQQPLSMLADFHRIGPPRALSATTMLRSNMSTTVARSLAAFIERKGREIKKTYLAGSK